MSGRGGASLGGEKSQVRVSGGCGVGVVGGAAMAMLDLADRRNDDDHRVGDKLSTAGAMDVSSSWLPSNSRQEELEPKAEMAAEVETAGTTEDRGSGSRGGSGAAAKLLMRSSESKSSAAQEQERGSSP